MTGFKSKKLVARIMPKPTVESKAFRVVNNATVDDAQWYTVRVYKNSCASWVRQSNNSQWYEHASMGRYGGLFDIHEKLYTMLALTWQ